MWKEYKLDKTEENCSVISADFGRLGSLNIKEIASFEEEKVFKYESDENHILFEFDLKKKTIELAVFEPEIKDIHWNDAINGNFKKKNKKVIKKENCIYISSLNKENCIKILKRDFGITCI